MGAKATIQEVRDRPVAWARAAIDIDTWCWETGGLRLAALSGAGILLGRSEIERDDRKGT